MSTLLLWLEAPLQSWGVDSRFGRRDTLPFPSRSGILGLMCAASGKGGEQETWLSTMTDFQQTIVAYARKNSAGIGQRWPLLSDFHMVGSGYETDDPWQNMLVPKKNDGGAPTGGGTKITHRLYLQDMAFACALDVPTDEANFLAESLCAPVWDISLGRKCCVPSDMIYRGTFADAGEALSKAQTIASGKDRVALFHVLEGAHSDNGDIMTLNDVPIRFGLHKKYKDRQVTVQFPPSEQEKN